MRSRSTLFCSNSSSIFANRDSTQPLQAFGVERIELLRWHPEGESDRSAALNASLVSHTDAGVSNYGAGDMLRPEFYPPSASRSRTPGLPHRGDAKAGIPEAPRTGIRRLAVVTDADRPAQCSGVNQDRNNGLCHTNYSEHQEFGVVENAERPHTCSTQREKKHLDSRDCD